MTKFSVVTYMGEWRVSRWPNAHKF